MNQETYTRAQLSAEASKAEITCRAAYSGTFVNTKMRQAEIDYRVAAMTRIKQIMCVIRDNDDIAQLISDRMKENV